MLLGLAQRALDALIAIWCNMATLLAVKTKLRWAFATDVIGRGALPTMLGLSRVEHPD